MNSHGEPTQFTPWTPKHHRGVVLFDLCTELEEINNLKIRDNDVWICTYPRSGTTLTQEIVYLIQTLDFETARHVLLQERSPYIDVVDPDPRKHLGGVKQVRELASPRVIKSHLHHFLLPGELRLGSGKIVYVVRNPNACALSFYKLFRWYESCQAESLRDYMELFLNDKAFVCPWWLHVLQYWEHRHDDNVLFLRYEQLVQLAIFKRTRQITYGKSPDFIGKTLPEEDINKIDEHTDIASMRGNAALNCTWHEAMYRTNKKYGGFINNGSIEGWRTEVPQDIQERMGEMLRRRLGHTDLVF